ncbi:hypothetical protein QFC22_000232 [Naganishia vaughanmartiniae]|uniref:Uncharacterized protein n=1 Tax=Naganishia vaughanmartiniae TaxID=1424756 RepID=A0ACC2XPS7_9TREE|nr:hypothetical protein QFC22_000232 [Naganishia vaughanmartiniae]
MAERNNRERPAGHRHDSAANPPTASTPSSFLSRVFRGSTSRSSTSEQSVPTTANLHHADTTKQRPSATPISTARSGSGPSPGISPILSPQLSSSSNRARTKSKSPTRARQRLQDITTAGIANLSLYEEREEEDTSATSVGILRHLSQTSGPGNTREATLVRRPPRSADQPSIRDLIKNLVYDEDSASTSHSHTTSSHLSNHERVNLATELAAELRIKAEDADIERRLRATLADDLSVSSVKQRPGISAVSDPLTRVILEAMGSELDVEDVVERLLNVPVRLIRDGDRTKQSSGQTLKTAGFQLLAILLLMRSSDALEQDLAQNKVESAHDTRFRSMMIDLCLSTSVDLPTSSETKSTTPGAFEVALGDMPNRIACLQVLTRHGRDITLNQNIVRTLVKWYHGLLAAWKHWCAEPGSWDADENAEAHTDVEPRGRQKVIGASNERDQSNSTITIHFVKDSFEWAAEDDHVPVIVRSLRSIWDLLVAIVTHNLPLFSGRDIETILNMAVTMIEQGIEATSLATPLQDTMVEVDPSVAKLDTPSESQPVSNGRARSGSLLTRNRTLKVPAAPPTTSEAGLSRASTMVSRNPSFKKDRHPASHGTSPTNTTSPQPKTPTNGTSGKTPPWATVLSPVLDLLHFLLQAKYLPPTSLVSVIQLLSLCYGWRTNLKSITQTSRPFEAVNGVMHSLNRTDQSQIEDFFKDLFTSKLVSRNAERALRSLLGGQVKVDTANEYQRRPDFKRDIIVGALGLTRVLLQTTYTAAQEKNVHAHELSPNFNLQSLAPTLLASMSDGSQPSTAGIRKSAEVDVQVLCIVDDYLTDLSCTALAVSDVEASTVSLDARQSNSRDPWFEGHLVCQFLQRGLTLAKGSDIILDLYSQISLRTITDPVALKMSVIMCRLPAVLGGLQSGPSSGLYLHTDFVNLLMQIPADLNNELALRVIDFYKREGLCLPPHSDWIDNVNKVMEAFFVGHYKGERNSKREIRQNAASLLFEHVYDYVQDFSESRTQLVSKCILPLLERTLAAEEDDTISDMAWETLTAAAVLETLEEDERKRASQRNASSDTASLAESIETLSLGLPDTISSCSARMRRLILSTGCNESCNHDTHLSVPPAPSSRRTTPMPMEAQADDRTRSNPRTRSTHDQLHTQSPDLSASVSSSTFRDLMGSFSPTFFSSNKDVPLISQSISSLPAAVTTASLSTGKPTGDVPEPKSPVGRDLTVEARDSRDSATALPSCKAVRSVKALIAIFTRLAFSLPRSVRADTLRLSRIPASARCIVIFSDLLQLLWVKYIAPHHEQLAQRDPERNGQSAEWHLSCQHARLMLLQWLVRLRANKQHRIWIKPYLDDGAEPMADLLGRSAKKRKASGDEILTAVSEEAANRRRKPQSESNQVPPPAPERGRVGRASGLELGSGRSRSRSRQPAPLASIQSAPVYRPIWQIPHVLDFEVPPDARASEGMTTYDPSVSEKDAHGIEGVWLPVSDYMSVAVAMLTEEKDWELMSYLLIFLPLQMANKHLFCGPKSSQAIRQLRRLICDGLSSGSFLSHIRLPIRPSEVLPAAYQMLSMFISYKSLFNKGEIGAILDVLVKGLQGQTTEIMRSSIQSLTIAVHEVTESVSQHLNSILELLANLITKGKVSIHALEFLNAVGSVPSLYANFTDEQYLTVFKVAIAYIQLHHQRTKDADDAISDQDRGDFTESQHVITMSYHAIYVWFLALSLDKRPTVVPFLSRNLMHAFTDGRIDEMAEVCYDWLARYTYGNADPKPTVSFLSEVVMHGDFAGTDKSISETAIAKSWLLGNTVLTIKTQPRSGWVTINAVRPSGTVSLLTKVENVPLLGLGEDNADLDSLPAVLMADRRVHSDGKGDGEPGNAAQDSSSQAVTSRRDSSSSSERRNSADFIWSGSSPSQRRKDVAILPGFVGLQLSAYPYISVDAPRGRLIPPDDRKLQVMIRNLDYIPIIDSHCIAVLYVGPGQKDEVDIFGNTDGSPAFLTFMAGLGRLIRLRGQKDVYTGGLDTNSDEDGEYAYAWWDDLSQTIFHAPHLMPNRPAIEGQKDFYSYKKRHVGNDYVHVVFNDSGEDYRFDTVSTQFRFVNLIISAHTAGVSGSSENPSDHDFFKVTIQKKAGIPDFSPIGDFKLVSAKALPVLIRQIALSANVMAQVFNHVETQGNMPYLTPWRQRYRQILRIRDSLPVLEHDENENDLDRLELLRE